MEKQPQRQVLFVLLWVLVGFILILLAVNAFFVYHLYLAPEEIPSKEDLIDQTLTAVLLTDVGIDDGAEELEATATQEPPASTPQPTETPQQPTETLSPDTSGDVLYIVKQGDTAQNIAESFEIKVEDLRARNQMLGDFLLIDQKLYIPPQGETHTPMLSFSSMEADDSYLLIPQTASDEETTFDISMEENQFAFQAREQLSQLVKDAFFFTSHYLEGDAPETVNVFVASNPFYPQSPVRVYYLPPDESQLFFLHDGSGDYADLNFHLAYGMAMLWGEEVWGGSPDPVLREGMAYSVADERNAGSGNLRLCDVAQAYQKMGKLPVLTEINSFDVEWTRNMVDLATAGCYYQYLSEKYPAEEVQALYISGDYSQLSSETFEAEVSFFESWLRMIETSQEIDAEAFVKQMDRLLEMNRLFFADMMGWEYKLDIYYALDQARLGLWRNDVRYAMVRMTTASAMLGLTTNTVELTPTPEDTSEPSAGPASTPTEDVFPGWKTPWPTITQRPTKCLPWDCGDDD